LNWFQWVIYNHAFSGRQFYRPRGARRFNWRYVVCTPIHYSSLPLPPHAHDLLTYTILDQLLICSVEISPRDYYYYYYPSKIRFEKICLPIALKKNDILYTSATRGGVRTRGSPTAPIQNLPTFHTIRFLFVRRNGAVTPGGDLDTI